MDGSSYLRMWRSIALPLTMPALVVVFVFELKASWTDLLRPLMFLRDVDLFTLPRGLLAIIASSSITGESHFELLMAAAVITTLPMVVLFFLGQRYFVEGIATTGSKG
jgi:multiple sugar transport system permease protein